MHTHPPAITFEMRQFRLSISEYELQHFNQHCASIESTLKLWVCGMYAEFKARNNLLKCPLAKFHAGFCLVSHILQFYGPYGRGS